MKNSKFDREEILAKIKFYRDQGFNHIQTARMLGMSRASVSTYSHRYGITGWPIGAAARDQKGKKNPNFKGGICRSTIRRTVNQVLLEVKRDLYTCEKCGKQSSVAFPRHHIDRDRSNNSPDNLIVLCISCHNREHMSERERDKLGRLT